MKLGDALKLLRSQSVPNYYFGINTMGGGEIWCIERTADDWEVYFSERGEKAQLKRYVLEDDAVEHFLEKLRRDIKEIDGRDIRTTVSVAAE